MNTRAIGFAPVVDDKCRKLILGSIPTSQSIKANEYYAHPQDRFWTIMGDLLLAKGQLTYNQKVNLLLKNKVALWDVVYSCERADDILDTNIRDVRLNDFKWFFEQYPKITKVYCNGEKAFDLFKKHFKKFKVSVEYLPSSGPNDPKTLLWKINQWRRIMRIERRQKKRKAYKAY